MAAEAAGGGSEQRAGREPAQVAAAPADRSLLRSLSEEYEQGSIDASILQSYVVAPNTDIESIRENSVRWMALAMDLGKTCLLSLSSD